MKKYICIHGHFYQPPRENAWLEEIEKQDSAFPYHDWNERISAECYGPNGASRILNEERRIIQIVNNYSNISFNFGATLLSWMELHDTTAYEAILKADLISRKLHNGHGNAIAQVYNHVIMPLANARDKETQIIWGIQDFVKRFDRTPEGMWLAETAVDTDTLEAMAANGIQYTILAPRQAKAYKKPGDSEWTNVNEDTIDTAQPYKCLLPSGRTIDIFFYNGKIARDVAFNGLLNSGKLFAERLMGAVNAGSDIPQLVNIATDGESYGHHHEHGDMALAACMGVLQKQEEVVITNYGEYLSWFPPQMEIRIHENSSWSCVHGVERWRSNCGCQDGAHPEYHQRWREPLRNALNWLRDHADIIFEKEAGAYTPHPWQLRNGYIDVILNRNEEQIRQFFLKYAPATMSDAQRVRLIRLLEMERHAQLMFTSCGWFFDEVSRIETKQILQYADRVIQIAEHEAPVKLYDEFVQLLSLAPSNVPKYGTAAGLYEQEIRPQRLTLTKVGMNHAILSLFDELPDRTDVFNYHVRTKFYEKIVAGDQVVSVGHIDLISKFTFAEESFRFAALYLGQHHIIGGYAEEMEEDDFEEMFLLIRDAFRKSDLNVVITTIRKYFGDQAFSFNDLFADEQENLLNRILQRDIDTAEANNREMYDHTYTLVNRLSLQKKTVPDLLLKNIQTVVNSEIKNILRQPRPNIYKLEQMTDEFINWKVPLDIQQIAMLAAIRVEALVQQLRFRPDDMSQLDLLSKLMIRFNDLGLRFRLWKIQNTYFSIGKDCIGNEAFIRTMSDEEYKKWLVKFKAVGEQFNLRFS